MKKHGLALLLLTISSASHAALGSHPILLSKNTSPLAKPLISNNSGLRLPGLQRFGDTSFQVLRLPGLASLDVSSTHVDDGFVRVGADIRLLNEENNGQRNGSNGLFNRNSGQRSGTGTLSGGNSGQSNTGSLFSRVNGGQSSGNSSLSNSDGGESGNSFFNTGNSSQASGTGSGTTFFGGGNSGQTSGSSGQSGSSN